jgi:hypothetical protein
MRWPSLVSPLLVIAVAGAQPAPTIAIVNARIFTGVAHEYADCEPYNAGVHRVPWRPVAPCV